MTLQVFISYKSEYRDFARKVQSRLHKWGYTTWFDLDDIPKGTYFRHAIQDGLDRSDILVGVMTQEAFQSREVMAEWDYFLSEDKPLLPLKYRECKPLYHLITIQWIDFLQDEAKGFADLRERLDELAAQLTLEPAPAAPSPAGAVVDDKITDVLDKAPLDRERAEAASPAAKPLPAAPQPQPFYGGQPSAPKRSLRGPLVRVALALASLVTIALAVIQLFSSSASPPSIATPPDTSLVPVFVIVASLVIAYWLYRNRQPLTAAPAERKRLEPAEPVDERQHLLNTVAATWINSSLIGAVDRLLTGAVLRHRDYGDSPLPTDASILDVFDDMQRELLILGEPGADRTRLLLELARGLIERARQDADKPIPVVFKLSSWAGRPLADWLVEELRRQYQMPNAAAQNWIEREQLTLLLDGLDEVAEPQRATCVEAINAFRQQYQRVDLAVTSRRDDYDLLTNKLNLRAALLLPA